MGQFLVMLGDWQKALIFICTESQWFLMILGDSTKNSEIYLGWFSVILKYLSVIHVNFWNLFRVILNDFWRFSMIPKNFWNLFGTILGDSWQYFVIHKKLWNLFGVIVGDSPWFSMILNDSQKLWNLFRLIFSNSLWFLVISKNNSEIYLGDSWQISMIYEKLWNLFWSIFDDSWWLSKNSEIYLGWISVIFNDIWWFTKNFDIYLGWFSVILIYLSVIHENSEI